MIVVKMVVETTTNKHAFAFDFFISLSRFMLNNQLNLWFREKKIRVYLLKKALYDLKLTPRT
jgi:hypothetical protein